MILIIHNLWEILSGALFVLGIIAGIGPQNLNIISHAIKRNHEIYVANVCFLSDIILITLGFIGLSLSSSHIIVLLINILGIMFLSWYLLIKIKGLFVVRSQYNVNDNILTRRQSILRALALTWLNPLVFIDTIVVIDGNALQYIGVDRLDFLVGALIGDFLWIYGLTILVRIFSHRLNRIWIWVMLDILTVIIMCLVLYKTILYII